MNSKERKQYLLNAFMDRETLHSNVCLQYKANVDYALMALVNSVHSQGNGLTA